MAGPTLEFLPPAQRQELHWMKESVRSRLNSMEYHDLAAAERGVLHSIQIYEWWQGPLPNDPERLARLFRLSKAAIARALPTLISAKLIVTTADGALIYSPMLEDEVKKSYAQYSGHKRGGEKTQEKKRLAREAAVAAEAERWIEANYPAYEARESPAGDFAD